MSLDDQYARALRGYADRHNKHVDDLVFEEVNRAYAEVVWNNGDGDDDVKGTTDERQDAPMP